jgi:peptidoglycan/xylan/chitin deacetylase (PgdA/CDA1 family)
MLRFTPRLLLLLSALSVGLTGCDQVKSKLRALLKSGTEAKGSTEPKVLTPEEQAMNKILENPEVFEAAPEAPVPKARAFELNKSATVSILGYHDFRDRGGTAMIISAPKFREQMHAIKESKIPVVPLSLVMEWKKGRANIPEECIVITMDDGWQGVYTLAYPILKEFGFPFTVYLYKEYVNIGGRSMTWVQIKEMMEHGCEVGSHSVSHAALTRKSGKTEEEYQAWLLEELVASKEFLEANLPGARISSFAYPFGNHTDDIAALCLQVGYDNAITVNNAKVAFDTPNAKLGRYIIHGDSDGNFKLATSFRSRGGDLGSGKVIASDAKDATGATLIPLTPAPDTSVPDRKPIISANLSKIGVIDPTSLTLRISGMGLVPVSYDAATMTASYQPPIKLRRRDMSATLSFKRAPDQPVELINWSFKIDLAAAYLPTTTIAEPPATTYGTQTPTPAPQN